MLGKLFRLEMKASARTIVPLYIGMFVVALIGGIRLRISISRALHQSGGVDPFFNVMADSTGIAELILVAMTIAVMVMTVLIVIQRFHRNLLEQEGYLMMTLPVTHSQLILSKLFGALCWVICSIVVIGLSWLALVLPVVAVEELVNEFIYLWNYWVTGPVMTTVIGYGVSGFISLVGLILLVYLSMMIGQLEQFHRYHMAVSVIAFVLIQWILGVIYSPVSGMIVSHIVAADDILGVMQAVTIYKIITGSINCVLYFLGTKWLMQNRLNI